MVEKNHTSNNFEQKYNETEKVYVPRTPELLDKFRHESVKRIIQPYLSAPSEPFSLRLRDTEKSGAHKYDATLKTTGKIIEAGKSREEYAGTITDNRFDYYTIDTLPTVRKRRVSPQQKIDIDFFDDGGQWVESEDPVAWNSFLDQHGYRTDDFIDMTGHVPDNELRAHALYRHEHGGHDAFRPYRPFDTDVALDAILPYVKNRVQLSRHRLPVVRMYGRSGSGKSHHLARLRKDLKAAGVSSHLISTDDYNIGMKRLISQNENRMPDNFDHMDVYDIARAREDILALLGGQSIRQYVFDWHTSEPKYQRTVESPDSGVIFVEGIWARSDAFDFADVSLNVDTPLATSLGQRIARDTRERREFADPERSMSYYLEYAEPEYRAI